MKFQRFFGDRMMKTQTGCVQRLSGNPFHIRIIEGISDQRIAQIFHMDTDLMGAAGFQCQADQAVPVFFFQHFIVSNGRFAMFKVDGTLDDGAVLSSQWSGDGSGGGSDPAARDPEVFPVDFPVPDHGCENTAADQMLCDDCQTGGVMIEPVDTAKDEGTVFLSKIPGEPVCKGMGVVAHRRMDRKIGWFVDHHEVFILVNDVQGMINRRYFFRYRSFLNVYS